MDQNNVGLEVARRKRLIKLVSLGGIIPMLIVFEILRRNCLIIPLLILANAIVFGHIAWILTLMRCPRCARFVFGMMKKEKCPHCGAQFTL
jgi:hypothetical protein